MEVLASHWEGAPGEFTKSAVTPLKVNVPPAYQVAGSKAPKDVSEVIPSQPEELSPDIGLSVWQKEAISLEEFVH